jgi:hypothetical protein
VGTAVPPAAHRRGTTLPVLQRRPVVVDAPTYARVLDELLPPPVTSLSSTQAIRSKQITAG